MLKASAAYDFNGHPEARKARLPSLLVRNVGRQFQYRQVATRVHARALFEILAVEPICQACSSTAEWTMLQIAARALAASLYMRATES